MSMPASALEPIRAAILVETLVRLVDAIRCLVLRNLRIRVRGKELGIDDFGTPGAAHREGVAYDGPLGLAPQAEDLAEVMD